ncbi:MAG TPA: hypothetical protein VL966_14325 [Alphaproteobacteria bacterium]|nr:hypothetical protein [Alphaproteobacteria bacterium]
MFARLRFRKGPDLEAIRTGSVFRRVRADRTVETAKVIAIDNDAYGIPHVRYEVVFGRPDRAPLAEGPRILALSRFAETYAA